MAASHNLSTARGLSSAQLQSELYEIEHGPQWYQEMKAKEEAVNKPIREFLDFYSIVNQFNVETLNKEFLLKVQNKGDENKNIDKFIGNATTLLNKMNQSPGQTINPSEYNEPLNLCINTGFVEAIVDIYVQQKVLTTKKVRNENAYVPIIDEQLDVDENIIFKNLMSKIRTSRPENNNNLPILTKIPIVPENLINVKILGTNELFESQKRTTLFRESYVKLLNFIRSEREFQAKQPLIKFYNFQLNNDLQKVQQKLIDSIKQSTTPENQAGLKQLVELNKKMSSFANYLKTNDNTQIYERIEELQERIDNETTDKPETDKQSIKRFEELLELKKQYSKISLQLESYKTEL